MRSARQRGLRDGRPAAAIHAQLHQAEPSGDPVPVARHTPPPGHRSDQICRTCAPSRAHGPSASARPRTTDSPAGDPGLRSAFRDIVDDGPIPLRRRQLHPKRWHRRAPPGRTANKPDTRCSVIQPAVSASCPSTRVTMSCTDISYTQIRQCATRGYSLEKEAREALGRLGVHAQLKRTTTQEFEGSLDFTGAAELGKLLAKAKVEGTASGGLSRGTETEFEPIGHCPRVRCLADQDP